MRTVYKYEIQVGHSTIQMPVGAEILHAGYQQRGKIMLWALVNNRESYEDREFLFTGTGHELEQSIGLLHISTFQDHDFVWHVFEVVR